MGPCGAALRAVEPRRQGGQFFAQTFGQLVPELREVLSIIGTSSSQPFTSTREQFLHVGLPGAPGRSVSRAPSSGSSPMAVSRAPAVPSQRSKIHLSTRLFSPKPGQRQLPSSLLRNQFT